MALRARPFSISSRLFLTAVICSVVILMIAGISLSEIQRRAAEREFDERLQVYLQSVAANIAARNANNPIDPYGLGDPRFTLPLSGWYWQITRTDLIPPETTSSLSLFGGRLPRLADLGIPAHDGLSREGYIIGPDERRLRLIERGVDVSADGKYLLQVAANADEIDASIAAFRQAMWLSFSVLAVALGITSAFQVQFGLRPLARLSSAIGDIRAGHSDRVDGAYPDDIAPLARELNLLIEANRDILERARTQVGNLAHALKTPLSVMVNEAADDESSLAEKVREQTGLMRDQVNWYLDRARAAARAGAIGVVTDVAPSVAALERTFAKIHKGRDLEFQSNLQSELKFRGERQDLEDMLGNLMDNASKWAKSKVVVEARSETESDGRRYIDFAISDDGPGLPPERRTDVMKRGQRLDETKPGSGLGLSIVADLAGLYGGSLTLETAAIGGLNARLRLPAV